MVIEPGEVIRDWKGVPVSKVSNVPLYLMSGIILLGWFTLDNLAADEQQSNQQAAADPVANKSLFTLSRETTRVMGPLRKDGTVDYVAALDAMASRGITVENNVAVSLWKIIGPGEILPEHRPEYFKRLGIAPLAVQGNYFITLDQLVQRAVVGKNVSEKQFAELDPQVRRKVFAAREKVWEQFDQAQERPWTAREFPLLAEWLLVNQESFKLLQQASQCRRYYSPLISTEKGLPMVSVLLPGLGQYRELVRALSIRITMNIGLGKVDEVIADSVTCHRLGRLVGQGWSLIDSLVGIAMDSMACQADVIAAHYGKLPPGKIKVWRQQLQGLTPLPSVVERITIGERFSYLDSAFGMVRVGPAALDQLGGEAGGEKGAFKDIVFKAWFNTVVNWDDVLRLGNQWYDELEVACRKPTYPQRLAAFAEIEQKLVKLGMSTGDPKTLLSSLLARGKGPRTVLGSFVSDILVTMLLPAVGKATIAEDRLVMNNRLVDVALALAAYRQETRQYPVQLEQLVPKYLDKIPEDLFVDKPVRYQRKSRGYVLYSVGPNQEDNKGQRQDADRDDVGFQIPVPIGQ